MDDLEPKYRIDGSCWKFIPVTSEGLFSNKPRDIFRHQLVVLELQLAVIFTLATIIHLFLKRFYLPRLLSEVLAGLILGPTVLGRFFPSAAGVLFPVESFNVLKTLTHFGFLFSLFLIGVKMDVNLIRKAGKREWTVGFVVNIFPILVGVHSTKYIALTVDKIDESSLDWVSFFAGKLMLTSFPVVAVVLMHLEIINSELGQVTLSSALISDVISVVLVNIDTYKQLSGFTSFRVVIKSVLLVLTLILFVVIVCRQVMYWIIRRTPQGKPVKDAYIFIVVIIVLMVAIVGENVGLQYMYGPFILGLTVPTGHPLASTLIDKLDTSISGLMLPLISTYCGFRLNLWEFNKPPPSWIIFTSTFGFLLKTTSGFIPALCLKMPVKDAIAVALMLNARGFVDLANFAINGKTMRIVPQEFSCAVLIVFFSAAFVPVLARKLYDPSKTYRGYEKRTIFNSSRNEGVRMLACAHREQDALSAIKLLQLLNPTIGSSLWVYGLTLEELVGGSSPLLLNHQLGQKTSSEGSRSEPIIGVFNYFKSKCSRPTQVHVYTAISPPSLMFEDVCWVSFDNSVSLIILPFHKIWNKNGNVISDSKHIRDLNTKVLKKAPCSIGILIDLDQDRSPLVIDQSSTYHVCVVYIGGKDDREALAIARRMIGWPSVFLTIVRFKDVSDSAKNVWETMLDDEYLREIKQQCNGNGNVLYREEKVRDGADTTVMVGSILDENYDLIIVGRHSAYEPSIIEGLSAWSDFPELGAIGDLLVSSEITKPVSFFVVEQQIIEK